MSIVSPCPCLPPRYLYPVSPPHLVYPLYHPFTHPQCCNQHFPLPLRLAGSLHPSYTRYRKHLMPQVPLFTHIGLFTRFCPSLARSRLFLKVLLSNWPVLKCAGDSLWCGCYIRKLVLNCESTEDFWIIYVLHWFTPRSFCYSLQYIEHNVLGKSDWPFCALKIWCESLSWNFFGWWCLC